jgi:putative transposase
MGTYVILKSFPPSVLRGLRRVARRAGLSDFWRGVLKRYGRAVLDQSQIEWIIKAKKEGKRNAEIARAQGISVRRVRQLYSQYRKTGTVPVLKRPGRPRAPAITEEERALIKDAHEKFRLCACYLEAVLAAQGVRINHNRIHAVLREEGLAVSEPHKQRRRKWIRYEREHSNSLWHTDWHKIKDPRWKDQWLTCYEDDASRCITGHGVYPTLTSQYSVEVLKRSIERFGKPRSILSDHGSTFYAVESVAREKGLTEFEKYLLRNKITFITGRVDHPQTNGKIEKFFDIFEKKIRFFPTIDEFMDWYNNVRPHGAFDLSKIETPIQMFYKKMEDRGIITDPSVLTGEETN